MSKDKAFEQKLMKETLEKMDEDLAIQVVLSAISLDYKKVLKQFSMACELMSKRSYENKTDLSDYDRKYLETATYTYSGIQKNIK